MCRDEKHREKRRKEDRSRPKKRFSLKDKEREREKRKALISEPVGEVRHTCHVGIDGTAFGLLQLDKKELVAPSVSPSSVRTNGTPAQAHLAPSLSQVSSPVILRSAAAREGITVRETMSLRDVLPSKVISFRASEGQWSWEGQWVKLICPHFSCLRSLD
ncbi:p21-Rho-binding domain protein, partial [Cooperia oncophora]